MREDLVFTITMETADKLISKLYEFGYEPECYEGCLVDNYFCVLGEDNNLQFFEEYESRNRNYLIILERPATTWTSQLKLILTDDRDKFYRYVDMFEAEQEEAC